MGKTNISILICVIVGSLFSSTSAAFASEPNYDEKYAHVVGGTNRPEFREEAVREALIHFHEIRIDECHRAIGLAGELKYVALVGHLKTIYRMKPEEAPSPEVAWRFDSLFRDGDRVRVVRALIRCGDPEAGTLALREAARAESMVADSAFYAVRNLKYLVTIETDVDVIAALTALIDGDRSEGKHVARCAARELAELEHYLRRSADPRRAACSKALDNIMAGEPALLRSETESSRRSPRPSWSETYALHMPRAVTPDDYPILDAILDYLLDR